MKVRLLAVAVLVVALVVAFGSWSSAEEPPAPISLAVAPFEEEVPEGGQALRIADRLARRLEARRLDRVIVLSDLGIEAMQRPQASDVRGWAARAEVDSVIVGRVVEVGDPESAPRALEISAELRSGHSGAVLSRHQATVAAKGDRSAAIDDEVESIAVEVLDALGYQEPAEMPAAVSAAAPSAEDSKGSPFGKLGKKDEPLSITSDELEVTSRDKARHLIFTQNVRVVQGDIDLRADRLEAFYPAGSSQPERLEAEGNVRVIQGDRRARCQRATYLEAESVVQCEGQAVLIQGCDEVRGQAIHFDVEQERVRVIGGASVLLRPDDESCEGAAQ